MKRREACLISCMLMAFIFLIPAVSAPLFHQGLARLFVDFAFVILLIGILMVGGFCLVGWAEKRSLSKAARGRRWMQFRFGARK